MEYLRVNGECPACALDDTISTLILNMEDYWECPLCKIQYQGVGELDGNSCLAILDERGTGDLKDDFWKAKEHIKEFILVRPPFFEDDDGIIKSKEELRSFIENVII